jgi:competence/damage-inducible protein CinA-like protein
MSALVRDGAPLRAAVIAVGDELVSGAQADSNSGWLARELARLGMEVVSIELVRDEEPEIAAAVERALGRAELVTVGGGLGPTLDDVTRHGVARSLGRELVEDEPTVAALREWFARRGVVMSETNHRQALFPAGARILANRAGTAPGFLAEQDGRAVAVMPGPPRELHVVWSEELVPWLVARGWTRPALAEQRFYLFGVPESQFAERSGAWMAREADPLLGCTVRDGTLTASFRARAHSDESRARLAARAVEFRARFADGIYSEEEWDLELVLGRELLARALRVSVAESCTGGLILSLLTRVPGISAVLAEGFVTYADEAKTRLVGVPPELLRAHGAVSREVAEAMALGAAGASGARLTLAVTGIAGPDGGSAEKPVGLVWLATALDGRVKSLERRLPPSDRDSIRRMAARTALFLGWKRLVRPD